jgi:hypothetical protein
LFVFEKVRTAALFLADKFRERKVRVHPSAPVRLALQHFFCDNVFSFKKQCALRSAFFL